MDDRETRILNLLETMVDDIKVLTDQAKTTVEVLNVIEARIAALEDDATKPGQ